MQNIICKIITKERKSYIYISLSMHGGNLEMEMTAGS